MLMHNWTFLNKLVKNGKKATQFFVVHSICLCRAKLKTEAIFSTFFCLFWTQHAAYPTAKDAFKDPTPYMEPHLIWTDLLLGLNFVLKHYGLQTVLHWKWEQSFEYRRITGAEIIELWGAAIISPLLTLFTHSIKNTVSGGVL